MDHRPPVAVMLGGGMTGERGQRLESGREIVAPELVILGLAPDAGRDVLAIGAGRARVGAHAFEGGHQFHCPLSSPAAATTQPTDVSHTSQARVACSGSASSWLQWA